MATEKGILLSKSPFYIIEAGTAGFTSTLEIRVWSGDFNSEPIDFTYELIKQALTESTTNNSFEISTLVNDEFDHLPNPLDLTAANRGEALWVNVKSFGGSVNRDDTWLAVNGYSDFLSGLNFSFTGSTLVSERILYQYDGIPITLPVYCDGLTNANQLVFKLNGSVVNTDDFSAFASSSNSYDKIQYTSNVFSQGAIDRVEVQDSVGAVLDAFTIKQFDCTKYTPYKVQFINRFGANQTIVFDLKATESIASEGNQYTRQVLEFNNGIPTYNTGRHQFKTYNSNVTKSITLNTNLIDETLNDSIGELISSEFLWVTDSNDLTSPINVSTDGVTYKTNVNDKTINYTIAFDYAFNTRNTIY